MRGQNIHMKKEHRYYIETELKKGTAVSMIAAAIGYTRQAVYKEIERGSFEKLDSQTWESKKEYAYDVGQRVHDDKKKAPKQKKLSQDSSYLQELSQMIRDKKYSPEAAQHLLGFLCCTKTIYNYVHSGYIGLDIHQLPYARKKKKQKVREAKTMPRGTSIEKRPEFIKDRDFYGHWEMDTVYSSKDDKTCLLVLSERMTRQELIFKIKDHTSGSVLGSLDALERKIGTPAFRKTFLSITCDNGSEFADFAALEKSCRTKGNRTKLYYCHPYSSWERGTNENINRMIRRWIPKGDDIGLYSKQEIAAIQDWINSYPRKIFGGLSANDLLQMIAKKECIKK